MVYGIIDIDNFTEFNLENSFECGNKLLINLEKLINLYIKPYEYRKLDGDEFLFSIKGTFEHNKSSIIQLMSEVEKKLNITISFGLLESKTKYSFKKVITELKMNLLIAKHNGKNRIFIKL